MARKYNKVTTMRIFPNEDGGAKFSNSKWTPYKDGSPADDQGCFAVYCAEISGE